MKKLFAFFSIILLAFTAVKAQPNLKPLQSDLTIHAAGLDTVANSASVTEVIKIQGSHHLVTFQTSVTKLTGNPTLGSVKIYGSVDSVKWDVIPVGLTSTGTVATTLSDTLAVTNVSTAQVHTWSFTPSKFQYYKVVCHGGNGATQTSTVRTEALWRDDD
jgi:hypothetical protein